MKKKYITCLFLKIWHGVKFATPSPLSPCTLCLSGKGFHESPVLFLNIFSGKSYKPFFRFQNCNMNLGFTRSFAFRKLTSILGCTTPVIGGMFLQKLKKQSSQKNPIFPTYTDHSSWKQASKTISAFFITSRGHLQNSNKVFLISNKNHPRMHVRLIRLFLSLPCFVTQSIVLRDWRIVSETRSCNLKTWLVTLDPFVKIKIIMNFGVHV